MTETVSLQYPKLQDRVKLWLQQLGDEGGLRWGWVLTCPPQAYKSCAGPALRQKEEPRGSNRVTSGLMDGGACVFEVRSWSDILCVQEAGHGGSLCSQREGKIASYMRMSVI